MILNDKDYLIELANGLDRAERIVIGPLQIEGAKVIQMSDEFAIEISKRLNEIAENME